MASNAKLLLNSTIINKGELSDNEKFDSIVMVLVEKTGFAFKVDTMRSIPIIYIWNVVLSSHPKNLGFIIDGNELDYIW